jgi:hypothetical protein
MPEHGTHGTVRVHEGTHVGRGHCAHPPTRVLRAPGGPVAQVMGRGIVDLECVGWEHCPFTRATVRGW